MKRPQILTIQLFLFSSVKASRRFQNLYHNEMQAKYIKITKIKYYLERQDTKFFIVVDIGMPISRQFPFLGDSGNRNLSFLGDWGNKSLFPGFQAGVRGDFGEHFVSDSNLV